MLFRVIAIILFLGSCTSVAPQAQRSLPTSWAGLAVSLDDADYLANESLRLVIQRQCKLGDLQFHRNPRRIAIFIEDVAGLIIHPIADIGFEPLTERALQMRAEEDGSYVYYFRLMPKREGDSIVIELLNVPIYTPNPRRRAFGAGVKIRFTKSDGKWTHTCTEGWIA